MAPLRPIHRVVAARIWVSMAADITAGGFSQ
jgi:hypothetical protein